jgi:putative membrane protein
MKDGDSAGVLGFKQPHPNLLKYYACVSLLWGPLFPIILLALYVRYRTQRYTFDAEGVSMRWGALFRRETRLNYSRLQDIHLLSNVVERWLGLARVQLQTASGSAEAELTIEGLREYQDVRDFLYARMRGGRATAPTSIRPETEVGIGGAEFVDGMRVVAQELAAIRHLIERLPGVGPERVSEVRHPQDDRKKEE